MTSRVASSVGGHLLLHFPRRRWVRVLQVGDERLEIDARIISAPLVVDVPVSRAAVTVILDELAIAR